MKHRKINDENKKTGCDQPCLEKCEQLKTLLTKHVILTKNESGAKYAGILSAVRSGEGRLCITRLQIINNSGGVTASKTDKSRWFDVSDCVVVEDK